MWNKPKAHLAQHEALKKFLHKKSPPIQTPFPLETTINRPLVNWHFCYRVFCHVFLLWRPLLFFKRAGKWGEVKSKRAEPGEPPPLFFILHVFSHFSPPLKEPLRWRELPWRVSLPVQGVLLKKSEIETRLTTVLCFRNCSPWTVANQQTKKARLCHRWAICRLVHFVGSGSAWSCC